MIFKVLEKKKNVITDVWLFATIEDAIGAISEKKIFLDVVDIQIQELQNKIVVTIKHNVNLKWGQKINSTSSLAKTFLVDFISAFKINKK